MKTARFEFDKNGQLVPAGDTTVDAATLRRVFTGADDPTRGYTEDVVAGAAYDVVANKTVPSGNDLN